MPLYECHCLACDLTFEVLAPLRDAGRKKPCPACGAPSPRVASAFAIAAAALPTVDQEAGIPARKRTDSRPLCSQNPHLPLLCHMDEKSARRFVAHANGHGSEYDDKVAKREDVRRKRGEPAPAGDASGHAHGHGHEFRRHARDQRSDSTHADAKGRSHAHAHEDGHAHGHDPAHGDGHGHDHGHDRPAAGAKDHRARRTGSRAGAAHSH
jgi:putative FmdB family regulatory protein